MKYQVSGGSIPPVAVVRLASSFVNCHNYSVGYELDIVYEKVSISWLFIMFHKGLILLNWWIMAT